MTDLLDGKPWEVRTGDALTLLRALPDGCVSCCVTSPPYLGLRSYSTDPQVWPGDTESCADGAHEWGTEEPGQRQRWGDTDTLSAKQASNQGSAANVAALERKGGAYCQRCNAWLGELGGEPTPELFVAHLVAIFREVRRVLHPSGSLWLNLGDSYATAGGAGTQGATGQRASRTFTAEGSSAKGVPAGLKPKDLIGIPWRVALALRDDGWYLRSDCIWWKPSAMPSSVRDRPTPDHEYLFLLTKSERYFYDDEAVRVDCAVSPGKRTKVPSGWDTGSGAHGAFHRNGRGDPEYRDEALPPTRHLRTVWRVNSSPSGEGHFAAFPPELVRRPVLASTSARGVCGACGEPWRPIVEKGEPDLAHQRACGGDRNGEYHGNGKRAAGVQAPGDTKSNILASMRERRVVGWAPTCRCCVQCDEAGIPLRSPKRRGHAPVPYPVEPAVVLDPFCGTGTTLAVAVALGRRAIGIELQPKYCAIAQKRLRNSLGLFGEVGLPAPGVASGNGHAAQGALAGLEAGG